MPRSVVVTAAGTLATWETLLGAMLLMGCYRRGSVWLILLTMAVMLPLSAYVWIENPVADCGCFGDMIVISNGATFIKNLVVTAMVISLIPYNKRVVGLISPYLQWIAAALTMVWVLIVALLGYNVQPLVDFRSWPEGTSLVEEAGDVDLSDMGFIYEKDGDRQTFTVDDLPDSTWTFVGRVEASAPDAARAKDFVAFDDEGEETADFISEEGQQILVLIPDLTKVDIAFTPWLNRLWDMLEKSGGTMTAVIATKGEWLNFWRDISLAEYPIYKADPTVIKELARGDMALVYLKDGVIQWKRNAISIDGEELIASLEAEEPATGYDSQHPLPLEQWEFDGNAVFVFLTGVLLIIMGFIAAADGVRRITRRLLRQHKRKRNNTKLNQ